MNKYDIDIKKHEFRRELKKDRAELTALTPITKEQRSQILEVFHIEDEEERREKIELLKNNIAGFSELYRGWLTEEEKQEELELLDMLDDDVASDKLSPFEWDPDLMEREGDPDAMSFHPLSNLLPRMSRTDLELMKADIATNGFRKQKPITLYEGQILDGRHRYEACMLAGVEPVFVEYEGDDPRGFVLSENINRRHLTVSQLAMIGAEMANVSHGGDRRPQGADLLHAVTLAEAAAWCKVSKRLITSARAIRAQDRALADQVKCGEKTVNQALQELRAAQEAAQAPRNESADTEPNHQQDAGSNQEPDDAEVSEVLEDLRALGINELSEEYVRRLRSLLERLCMLRGWE